MVMVVGPLEILIIVSMLNSYAGWAIVASGLLTNNSMLIVTGATIASSGIFLSQNMYIIIFSED